MKPLSLIFRMCLSSAWRSRRQHTLVPRVTGEVVELVGILSQVVQLLGGLRAPEALLERRQPTGEVELLPLLIALLIPHEGHVLPVRAVRHVVAHVQVAPVTDRALQVVALVHPAALPPGVRVPAPRSSEKRPALHVVRCLDSGQREYRGREVGEVDRRVDRRSG
jgi:hypothetical protein